MRTIRIILAMVLLLPVISCNAQGTEETATAGKLGVNGQTLLLVNGAKKINITNEGFMYARTDPEKLKTLIKEKVDGLLKL